MDEQLQIRLRTFKLGSKRLLDAVEEALDSNVPWEEIEPLLNTNRQERKQRQRKPIGLSPWHFETEKDGYFAPRTKRCTIPERHTDRHWNGQCR